MRKTLVADLRTRLRAETRDLHESAEAAVRRHAPLTQRRGYARFLRGMQTLHATFDPSLTRAARQVGLEPMTARALDAIAADLRVLDSSVSIPPGSRAVASDGDPARDLGTLYVFEGSALGAAVLVKQLREHYGNAATLEYLSLLDAQRAQRWPVVTRALAAAELDVDRDAVVAGARDTFQCLIDTFEAEGSAGGHPT